MALAPGVRLGPYEVLALIGAGGMGEVYKARDMRLDRSVAIKVLPPELAGDAERRARFTREAKTISALNHPHICTLYDVGEAPAPSDARAGSSVGVVGAGLSRPDLQFLVMEYLDGETLAARLARVGGAKAPPLRLEEALECATQIADALAAAHKQGVIHRDLKPGNVMLVGRGGPSGPPIVKLLDFGLAKLLGHGEQPAAASLMSAPTQSGPLTGQGAIVGTLQYMAPEQLEGKEVDARTDLFAFGAIVYEMMTGRRAFEGTSAASLIGAILEREPAPIAQRQPLTPPGLERLVRKCLAKSPDGRWYSAHDVADELRWISQTGSTPALASPVRHRARWRTAGLPAALVCVVALAAFVSWRLVRSPSAAPPPVARITLSVSPDNSLILDGGVAISPDGQTLAFAARSPEGSRLYVRRLDEWQPRAVPGTDAASNPFFSPDGTWVAFFRRGQGRLEKVPLHGGSPQVICKSSQVNGGWGRDGNIVFGAWPDVGLWRVSADGGTPELLTRPSEGSGVRYMWPNRLPDDRAVLFTVWREGRASIAALVPGASEPRTIVESGLRPRYLPTGHLLYVADGHLFAVPFDAQRLEVRGAATVVIDDVNENAQTADYDVSANGTLVYVPSQSSLDALVWKDRRATTIPLALSPRRYANPTLSPDGRRVAVNVRQGAATNIWVGSVEREPITRLTFGNDDSGGVWSPDGRRLVFTSGQNGRYNLFWTLTDGSGTAERLTESAYAQRPTSWSPYGDVLLFNTNTDPSTKLDIWALSLDRKEARPLVKTPFREEEAIFSPDGHWVAYQSDESGRFEVYVQAYPGPGVRRQISVDGGQAVSWNRNGRELFYQTATAMMVVPVLDAQTMRVGAPVRLFAYAKPNAEGRVSYDVSPDGQRFLMIEKADAGRAPSQLNLVQNWVEELKTKVPAGR